MPACPECQFAGSITGTTCPRCGAFLKKSPANHKRLQIYFYCWCFLPMVLVGLVAVLNHQTDPVMAAISGISRGIFIVGGWIIAAIIALRLDRLGSP